MLGMTGDLRSGSCAGSTLIYVESSVFFTQIIKRLSIGRPNRFAVFTAKCSQLPVSGFFIRRIHPYVTCDGRYLMLTPIIFIAFLILIKYHPFLINRNTLHRHRRIKDRTAALYRHFIYLPELSVGREKNRFGRRHNIRGKQNMSGIAKCHRGFAPRMGSQPARLAALFGNDIDIHASHTVGSESDAFAVRTPYRLRIMGRIGSKLHSTSTADRHCVNIAFISESNRSPIGRNGAMTHPKRSILRKSKACHTGSGKG